MKIDPYNHEQRYKKWKVQVLVSGIPTISEQNSDLILQYLEDMEHGINISSINKRRGRSYIRLNTLKEKMIFFSRKFKEIFDIDCIIEIKEEQLLLFFSQMRTGEISRNDGKKFQSTSYYVKIFKAFWHWYQKVNRKVGKDIPDITTDLDSRAEKPKWVYLTKEQVRKLCGRAKYEYKVLIMFLFDSGIRSPTELINVKVSDFYNDFRELQIRDEISKTFGRKIKLMLCSGLVKEYVQEKGLKEDDHPFLIKPATVNKYLKRLAKKVLKRIISI